MTGQASPIRSDPRAVIGEVDALLTPFHAERLARLGPEASGLYAHYQDLVKRGSLFRAVEFERLDLILRQLPLHQHYVVLRAGLGELALALAHAGCRVTAWEADDARRAALTAGYEHLGARSPAIRDNLEIAGRSPDSIRIDPGETSLGVAFDFRFQGDDAFAATRATVRTHALLYEPRQFLRQRADASAEAEVRTLLAAAGFDGFRPVPLWGAAFATRGPLQPVREPARFVAGDRTHTVVESACKGVIAIAGGSYCGSTLLTMLLDSHPLVAGGGELHWLTKDSPRGVCALCGEACEVWTASARTCAEPENLYDLTATVMGRPYVCDASKMPDWFAAMAPLHPALPRTTVLLVKHPVRQAASFLHKAAVREDMTAYRDPEHVMRQLAANHRRAVELLNIDMVIKYEDLVADPRAVITRILAGQGLAWSDAIDAWQSPSHHHIGGNPGPLVQLDRSRRPESEILARKYRGEGLFLDDSYREVLDEATFAALSENPLTLEICERFDYGSLPFGQGVNGGG